MAGDMASLTVSFAYQLLFLATGVITTICNQLVAYNGAGEKTTLLLSVPTYLGMAMVSALMCCDQDSSSTLVVQERKSGNLLIFLSALVDVVSNVICMIGLYMTGSGLFQVVYSAVVCFAALLSRVLLKKKLGWLQLAGIAVIFSGLALTSLDASVIPDRKARGEELGVFVGILVTLVGCIGYAGSYVLNEYILLSMPTLAPKRLCMLVGFYGTLLLSIYMGLYTLPNWKTLVEDPIKAHNGDEDTVLVLYVALTASSFLHNLAYFNLLRLTGAVSTGVLTALRTIGVFFASAALFCDISSVQCMTSQKLAAVVLVCGGVLAYACGKGSGKQEEEEEGGRLVGATWKGDVDAGVEMAGGLAKREDEPIALLKEILTGVLE